MRRFASLVICAAVTAAGFGQTPAQTRPQGSGQSPSTQPADHSTDLQLGKLFRSRTQGIQFNPPAGSAMIRELSTGDIVRYVFADGSWDVRLKPIPLRAPMKLSAEPDAGVLELSASQLTESNPSAKILRREVIQLHEKEVGVIEATYNAGSERVFAQQGIFSDYEKTGQHYYSLQMTSKDLPNENNRSARQMFAMMLDSVQVLDRSEVKKEQERRLFKTRDLWVLLDKKTILAALQPLHFMRVVKDGRDVGFIQVNERQATHNGNPGYEIIIHSRMEVDQPQAHSDLTASATDNQPAGNGIVVPGRIGPAAIAATQPAAAQNLYTLSTYFVTFDREHEDWTTVTQTDRDVANQLTEFAYSDKTFHRKFDRAKARELAQPTTSSSIGPATNPADKAGHAFIDPKEPPIIEVPKYLLDVSYSHGRRQDPPTDIQLPPFYLPQALGQILPRVVPTDPGLYMFAFYVSGERNLMARYLDVELPRDVNLDGQIVHAVPVVDRIGLDGIATTHYVTRKGEWLGSINEDSGISVFPSDANTLKGLWGTGFAICPEPPVDDVGGDPASPNMQNVQPNGR